MVKQYVPSRWIAMNRIGLVAKEPSVHMSRESFQERSSRLAWAKVEPRFDSLRTDPRFKSLLVRVKLISKGDGRVGIRGWLKGPEK